MRVYQFRHFGSFGKDVNRRRHLCLRFAGVSAGRRTPGYFFVGCGEPAGSAVDVGCAAAAAGDGDACGVATGEGCGACSGKPDCSTDLVPVIAGSESIKAIRKKAAAAPIVILASKLAVPRGPNAVLETELEKSAPASDFPGCSRIETIKTTHARMNSP